MEKIKIFYDYQIMLAQKYGGISRYFYELLTNINDTEDAYAEAFCYRNRNKYFENYFGKNTDKVRRGDGFINRLLSKSKMKAYDIVHPTYYHPYVLKNRKSKIVITIYDMIHELFPEMFSEKDKTVTYKKQMLYGVDHIIAISESTKRDILKFYPDISPDKITVIYIGSNMMPVKECGILLPEKFILFVGNREKYKNFLTFMKSVKPLLEHDSELHLVCLGGGAFNEEEKALILGVEKRVIQIDAFDSALAYAYSKALCFVFPSLYEGFGIPTLEAFACDCPAVISNTSSMPEVGGDAVVYFNPYDENDIRDKIHSVIKDEALRDKLIASGRARLEKFTWNNITEQTIDCYKKVLDR